MAQCGEDIRWRLAGKQHLIAAFLACPVQPDMRAIACVGFAWRLHKAHPACGHQLCGAHRAIVPQKFTKFRPITRGGVDNASAEHCAVAVKFREGACHTQRFKQTATRIFQHRIPAHNGIFAVGQRPRHDVDENVAGGRAIFVLLARNGLQGARFGIAGNIFAAIEKQHARRVCIKNLDTAFRHFGVVQTRRHM